MNTIGVFGGTTKQEDLAYAVVQFCIEKLMPRMKTLDICVELSDDMENADGFCLAVNKREFVIEIDSNLKGEDFITALTHEMVHVKQYVMKELKDSYWKGEYFDGPYTDAPWEIEAYELEQTLLEGFLNIKKGAA